MDIVTRREWAARPPKSTTKLPWSDIDAVAVHYTAAQTEVLDPSQYYARLRGIQDMHMAPGGLGTKEGGADIAYNFLFSPTGLAFEGRGWEIMSGATYQHNDHTIALCFMGTDNQKRDDVGDKGRRALANLLFESESRSKKQLGPTHVQHGPPGKLAVSGHRLYVNTSCPGDEIDGFIRTRGWEAYRENPKIGYPKYFFNWAAWYLGEGAYKNYGPRYKPLRPKNPRIPVAPIYWVSLRRFLRARESKEL